jgi:hypothetical protein
MNCLLAANSDSLNADVNVVSEWLQRVLPTFRLHIHSEVTTETPSDTQISLQVPGWWEPYRAIAIGK